METVTEWATQDQHLTVEIPKKLAALDRLLIAIKDSGGFLTPSDLSRLADLDRLRMVLVRCGGGRFICPAQDATHFMEIVNASGQHSKADLTDYVRDVSLPTSDPAYRT